MAFGEMHYGYRFTGAKRQKVTCTDHFYYISLLQTLQTLLKQEDILSEVLNPHQRQDNILGDYCDGKHFRTHPLFSNDPHALQIIAYYDELEVANPLGSYVKVHKLGVLSFFLGNIRPQFRSSLKAYNVLAIAKHQDVVTYGINKLLTPFVEELKTLYLEGVSISVNANKKTLHGALLAFLADNLAAHLVGGFKGSMSFALRICRSCMVTPETMQEARYYQESKCQLRDPETHFEQCSKLTGPLKDHYSTNYGINHLSVLEEVPGFSVVTSMPHDIMHDLFEGIVPLELKLLLSHCITCKYFTLQELNVRILAFDFPENMPTSISDISHIRQSASQMMTLTRFLPLIIGDKIPLEDDHWVSFLLLLKICGLSLSPSFTPDNVAYLSVLIEEKLSLFRQLHPGIRLIPKQHYTVHYPSQIENFGPLLHSWTMRQESKLSFIKRVSRQSNFKNVCKTAARKHQFWFCSKLVSLPHLLLPYLEKSPKGYTTCLENELDYVQVELLRIMVSFCTKGGL